MYLLNVNDLNTISSIQEYVNYTIIQPFCLDLDDNYSAPQDSYNVTFKSLFDQLKEPEINFTKLIWGFELWIDEK
ncbi:6801_t:CDS:2 [Diversispora eburnea]|uniref:6801_t:CDS:1 n=1 Tax=Diversispora eburnea TaxID=1213867 RepID=A0A9N9EX39_9GLOM|nr:6801_t:CDS:2 [Diversispora eburnea]